MLTIPTAAANRLNNCQRLYPSMTIFPGLHPSWKGAVNSLYGPRGKSTLISNQADIIPRWPPSGCDGDHRSRFRQGRKAAVIGEVHVSAFDPQRTSRGLKSRSAAGSLWIVYAIVWMAAPEGRHAPRFRTIQVWPKDFSASLQRVERAADRQRRGRKPNVRHEAARVHHAVRRRGGVAAGGERAAGDSRYWHLGCAGAAIHGKCIGNSPRIERDRTCGRPQRGDGIPLGRGAA